MLYYTCYILSADIYIIDHYAVFKIGVSHLIVTGVAADRISNRNRSVKEALVDPRPPSPRRGRAEQQTIVGILMGDSTQFTGEQTHKQLTNGQRALFGD